MPAETPTPVSLGEIAALAAWHREEAQLNRRSADNELAYGHDEIADRDNVEAAFHDRAATSLESLEAVMRTMPERGPAHDDRCMPEDGCDCASGPVEEFIARLRSLTTPGGRQPAGGGTDGT